MSYLPLNFWIALFTDAKIFGGFLANNQKNVNFQKLLLVFLWHQNDRSKQKYLDDVIYKNVGKLTTPNVYIIRFFGFCLFPGYCPNAKYKRTDFKDL